MIQNINPHKLSNEYDPSAKPSMSDFVCVFNEGQILVKETSQDEFVYPTICETGIDEEYIYLFAIDGRKYFLAVNEPSCPEGYEYISIRSIRDRRLGSQVNVFALYTAKHLMDWYRDNRFCGRCGGRMQHSESERMMECPECGYTSYPRIMPAVIVGVINGDKLLITKYRTGFKHFALIAGFTEIGETAEETVMREVMEEAGIRVKKITYYKSQPWGVANDLLLGYFCEVDGDTSIHMDSNELKYAEWVNREEIVLQPDNYSLTNEMMYMFKKGFSL